MRPYEARITQLTGFFRMVEASSAWTEIQSRTKDSLALCVRHKIAQSIITSL